jgi:hypothetical protein
MGIIFLTYCMQIFRRMLFIDFFFLSSIHFLKNGTFSVNKL